MLALTLAAVLSGCGKERDANEGTRYLGNNSQSMSEVLARSAPAGLAAQVQALDVQSAIFRYAGLAAIRLTATAQPTATPAYAVPDVPSVTDTERDVPAVSGDGGGVAAFTQGYLDYGGNPGWLDHFVYDVLPCEGGGAWYEFGDYSGSGYVSPAQFHPASWASAAAATGLSNPHDGYHVGANVAWWSNAVSDPWGSGGWPVCGHRGGW